MNLRIAVSSILPRTSTEKFNNWGGHQVLAKLKKWLQVLHIDKQAFVTTAICAKKVILGNEYLREHLTKGRYLRKADGTACSIGIFGVTSNYLKLVLNDVLQLTTNKRKLDNWHAFSQFSGYFRSPEETRRKPTTFRTAGDFWCTGHLE